MYYEQFPEPGMTARVYFIGVYSYSDVTPLLDSLHPHFWSVEASRWGSEPPAAGGWGPETALVLEFIHDHSAAIAASIGVFSATAFWAGFFQKMGEDAWDAVRRQIGRLAERGEIPGSAGRQYKPLVIKVETMHFVFDGPMTEDEFQKRRELAAKYLARMPDAATLPRFTNPERNYCYWNGEYQRWEARTYDPAWGADDWIDWPSGKEE